MRRQIGFSQSELARLCGVSPATISRHVDQRVIPVGEIQLGRRRQYSETQVQAITRFYSERTRGETLGKFQYDTFNRESNSL